MTTNNTHQPTLIAVAYRAVSRNTSGPGREASAASKPRATLEEAMADLNEHAAFDAWVCDSTKTATSHSYSIELITEQDLNAYEADRAEELYWKYAE